MAVDALTFGQGTPFGGAGRPASSLPPPRQPYTWQPTADGEERSFPVPATWGPGARAGTARITNNTRGQLAVVIGTGRQVADAPDTIVGAYSTSTITLDADGVSVRWDGTPGSAGGREQTVTVEIVAESGPPTSSSLVEPTFPAAQDTAWSPPPAGGDGELGRFRDPSLSFVAGGTNQPGETIVACAIENRTTFRLICRAASAAGPAVGEIEPMSSTTLLVGDPILFVSTKGPNLNRGGGDQYVQFSALDVVPRLDPSASFPLAGVHEPGGVMLQVGKGALYTYSALGHLVYSIPAGKVLVIRSMQLQLLTNGGVVGSLDSVAVTASRGLDGAGVATRILECGQINGLGVQPGPAYVEGPIIVPAQAGGPANEIRLAPTLPLAAAGWIANFQWAAWLLPDIQ